MQKIIPIVLAGGSGTRLWPLSQVTLPKQFIKLFDNVSSFQKTLLRNKNFNTILVVTTDKYTNIVLSQSKEVNIEIEIIVEPIAKNTAASCIVSALHWYNEPVTLMFLPADHEIHTEEKYLKLVTLASKLANTNLVTIGIRPTNINSNFGYINIGNKIEEHCYFIDSFQEKPNMTNITQEFNKENVLWNSGIYLINSRYLINQSSILQPQLYEQVYDSYILSTKYDNILYLARKPYECIKAISFDYAITTIVKNKIVYLADFYWRDLGNWETLTELLFDKINSNPITTDNLKQYPQDIVIEPCVGNKKTVESTTDLECANDNINNRKIHHYSCCDNANRVYVADDYNFNSFMKDIIIPNLYKLSNAYHQEGIYYKKWGYYNLLVNSDKYKIKELIVYPKSSLSLQYHNHRAEFWVIVKGIGELMKGSTQKTLTKMLIKESDFIYIPQKHLHKLINNSDYELRVIEIQIGLTLDEEDIVRLENITTS